MRNKSLVLLIVLSMGLITGCWNRRELNDLAIAVGIGIDKFGDDYKVSVQVVEPNEIAGQKGGDATPVTMFQATGHSIFEAARRMTTDSPRKIYFSHLRMLIISESVAREGIANTLDFLSRDHELRTDFFIAVARNNTAENTLKILTPIEKIPAVKLHSTLESSEKSWAPATTVTLDELLTTLVSTGKQAVLTGLEIKGDQQTGERKSNVQVVKNPAKLQYSGIAVFDGDKLTGWLNEDESKAYTYIDNSIKSTAGVIDCPDGGTVTIETIRSDTKVTGNVLDGEPEIHVMVRSEVNIAEVQCSVDLTKTEMIAELERRNNKSIQSIIKKAIKKVQQKYKVDIFGFGEVIRRSDPKAWKSLQHNWDKHFQQLPVDITVITEIRRFGTVTNSFQEYIQKINRSGGD